MLRQKLTVFMLAKILYIHLQMRIRNINSSSNQRKAMVGEVYQYLKWFDAVAQFDGVCAGQRPQAPLYFDPYPEGEDDRASPIVSRHPRRALLQRTSNIGRDHTS
jgi:hypothetical protein